MLDRLIPRLLAPNRTRRNPPPSGYPHHTNRLSVAAARRYFGLFPLPQPPFLGTTFSIFTVSPIEGRHLAFAHWDVRFALRRWSRLLHGGMSIPLHRFLCYALSGFGI